MSEKTLAAYDSVARMLGELIADATCHEEVTVYSEAIAHNAELAEKETASDVPAPDAAEKNIPFDNSNMRLLELSRKFPAGTKVAVIDPDVRSFGSSGTVLAINCDGLADVSLDNGKFVGLNAEFRPAQLQIIEEAKENGH